MMSASIFTFGEEAVKKTKKKKDDVLMEREVDENNNNINNSVRDNEQHHGATQETSKEGNVVMTTSTSCQYSPPLTDNGTADATPSVHCDQCIWLTALCLLVCVAKLLMVRILNLFCHVPQHCAEKLDQIKVEKSMCCKRLERYYRCQRRIAKRKESCVVQAVSAVQSWDCPISLMMKMNKHLCMPPPLPYKRRRGNQAVQTTIVNDDANTMQSVPENDSNPIKKKDDDDDGDEMNPSTQVMPTTTVETTTAPDEFISDDSEKGIDGTDHTDTTDASSTISKDTNGSIDEISDEPDKVQDDTKTKKKTRKDKGTKKKKKKKDRSNSSDRSKSKRAGRKRNKARALREMPAQPTPLIVLARMQHWSSLTERAPMAKEEAQYKDPDGLLPLHWACSGGPPEETIQALLEAYPEASKEVDTEGSTALHFACHYGGSAGVVELLVRSYPAAVRMQDKYGRTPLFHAVEKAANMDVLETLVRSDPAMITTPCYQPSYYGGHGTLTGSKGAHRRSSMVYRPGTRTPLFVAWTAALRSSSRSRRFLQPSTRSNCKVWEKGDFLLRIAHEDSTGSSATQFYQPLHVSIEFDAFLPIGVFESLLEAFPDQAQERDNDGRLPLAIAAGSTSLGRERAVEMIEALLKVFPEAAAMPDSNGRFPFALAASTGKTWNDGLHQIFQAAPQLLSVPDGQTGLPPLLLSASSDTAGEGSSSAVDNQDPWNNPYIQLPVRRSNLTGKTRGKGCDGCCDTCTQPTDDFSSDSAFDSDSESSRAETAHLSTIYEILIRDPAIITN